MFRLKSFSEKSQPIEESLTKPQVKEIFSNDGFKVGIEYELYNHQFLDAMGLPNAEDSLLIHQFGEVLMEVRRQNIKRISSNKRSQKVYTDDDILDDFEQKDRDRLFLFFIGKKIKPRALRDSIYYFVTDEGRTFFTEDLKKEYYKKDVIEKYKKKRNEYFLFNHEFKNLLKQKEIKFDDIRKFYRKQENLPKCVDSPIITSSKSKSSTSKWMIKEDESVTPGFGGIEFISPPMSVSDTLKTSKEMFDYIGRIGNTNSFYTDGPDEKRNQQCGLHINISISPERMKNFDPTKFILFSNESQVDNEKVFGDRKDSEHIMTVVKQLKRKFQNYNTSKGDKEKKELFDSFIKDNMKKALATMDVQLLTGWGGASADKFANVNLQNVQPHKRIIRKKNERIEIRYFGGQDYEKKHDLFKRILSELLYALDVATNPEKEKQKYMKKVYRLVNLMLNSKDK